MKRGRQWWFYFNGRRSKSIANKQTKKQ